jgi:hypothetical protein
MSRAATVGVVVAALTAACAPSPMSPSAPPEVSPVSPSAPLEVVDAVDDVVGPTSDPAVWVQIDDSPWIDIRSLTISRTSTDLKASLELTESPDPAASMTYSLEIDTSLDGTADYSLWAEYFGDGTARPGLVPWGDEEALFDEAFPGTLTVDETSLTWIVPLEYLHGESLRVAAVAQRSGEGPDAGLYAEDWVPDQTTPGQIDSWIALP